MMVRLNHTFIAAIVLCSYSYAPSREEILGRLVKSQPTGVKCDEVLAALSYVNKELAPILTMTVAKKELVKKTKAFFSSNPDKKAMHIAIYGWNNSGKSFLMQALESEFSGSDIVVLTAGGATSEQMFEGSIQRWDREGYQGKQVVILYHCAWERGPLGGGTPQQDPNLNALKFLGKTVDLNVGIYNPKTTEPLPGKYYYDFLVENPRSVRKAPLPK